MTRDRNCESLTVSGIGAGRMLPVVVFDVALVISPDDSINIVAVAAILSVLPTAGVICLVVGRCAVLKLSANTSRLQHYHIHWSVVTKKTCSHP